MAVNGSAKLKDVQTIRMANLLQTVARLYNIQAKYRDGFGKYAPRRLKPS